MVAQEVDNPVNWDDTLNESPNIPSFVSRVISGLPRHIIPMLATWAVWGFFGFIVLSSVRGIADDFGAGGIAGGASRMFGLDPNAIAGVASTGMSRDEIEKARNSVLPAEPAEYKIAEVEGWEVQENYTGYVLIALGGVLFLGAGVFGVLKGRNSQPGADADAERTRARLVAPCSSTGC